MKDDVLGEKNKDPKTEIQTKHTVSCAPNFFTSNYSLYDLNSLFL